MNSYLSYLDVQTDEDLYVLDQLSTIKSFINRQPYSMTPQQIQQVHVKFNNFYQNRVNSSQSQLSSQT